MAEIDGRAIRRLDVYSGSKMPGNSGVCLIYANARDFRSLNEFIEMKKSHQGDINK